MNILIIIILSLVFYTAYVATTGVFYDGFVFVVTIILIATIKIISTLEDGLTALIRLVGSPSPRLNYISQILEKIRDIIRDEIHRPKKGD